MLFVLLPLTGVLASLAPTDWIGALVDPEVTRAIGLTLLAAAIATLLALLTGVPLAHLLARQRSTGWGLVQSAINLPVVVPHTAAGIALLVVFGRRGILGRWLTPLGIAFTDNLAGIVVAMLFVSLPFLVNASCEAFRAVDRELEEAARVDGATPWQTFRHVTLPLAWRGILAGALMMWARGMSEFGAVVILAYHPKIAPVLVYERFAGFGLRAAQSVAALLVLAALVVFVVLRLVVQRAPSADG